MMMIKYKIGLLLSGILISLSACQDTVIPDKEVEEGEDLVPVILDLRDVFGEGTYSLTPQPDEDGTSSENKITDVRVYIFRSDGSCQKILKSTDGTLPIGPELITTGEKNFVAIANAGGNITGLPEPDPGDNYTITHAELLRKVSDAKSTVPGSPFLMTGGKGSVTIPKQTGAASQVLPVTIDVSRTVSKVTFNFKKSGKAIPRKIAIKKLTLVNGAERVGLFDELDADTVSHGVTKEYTTFDNGSAGEKDTVPASGYCRAVDTIYTYENLARKNKDVATYFEVEALVGNATQRSCRVYLAENPNGGDTVWDVKRNFWYDVFLDIQDPGLDSVYVTVNVSKWNVAAPQDTVLGGGYEITEMASPFKLVKNYTVADTARQSNIAAIHTHSKGASWFRLKVSDGVGWELNCKSGAEGVFSIDSGATWQSSSLSGTGDDQAHLIYVYRPYVENGEPNYGPSFTLKVDGHEVRDFVVQPRDTVPIPTNCYILRPKLSGTPANESRAYIPLAGVYRYWEDYVLANGDTIPPGNGSIEAEVLWQDSLSVVPSVSVINASKRDQAYIKVEAGTAQGNAVVAMKVGGTIYWSFHIWVTEYNPYEAAGQKLYIPSGNQGNIFMDRNLGALSNKYDPQGKAYGLYYQFGRKDPFPGGKYYDGSGNPQLALSSGDLSGSASTLRPLEAIPATLKEPMKFYDSDGSLGYLLAENAYLWHTEKGNKTAFDPCPEGWRIPKQENSPSASSPWAYLSNINFTTSSTGSIYMDGRYHTSAGYYPLSGFIETHTITETSGKALYWSSYYERNISNFFGTGLYFDNTSSVTYNYDIYWAKGASVRCVVDANYLKNAAGGGLFGNSAKDMVNKIIP